ncbi:MAG: hypothetical protein IJ111_00910 [Eggerthellaceae bacterium]|nr:hypothetical protein [Eggerthellaceae bacterium]
METQRLRLAKDGSLDLEFVESEALERYDALALEALGECRASMTMSLRFLNPALWHLPFERAILPHALATSGRTLRYDPERACERYLDGTELTRDYLHAVLHCVFHHPFDKRQQEYEAWSLACDIAVELAAIGMCGERFPSMRDAERLAAAGKLRDIARNLTAPALYQVLRSGGPGEALYEGHGLRKGDLGELAELFKRDAHDLWAVHPQTREEQSQSQGGTQAIPDLQGRASGAPQANSPEDDPSSAFRSQQAGGGNQGAESPERQEHRQRAEQAESSQTPEDARGEHERQDRGPDAPDEETAAEWSRISKKVEAELRAQQHSITGEGALLQSLKAANRKPADYDGFLRRFATIGEDMRVSDDEFDYVYYTYGLARYGNVPLVEPLEYTESERVREFVIALDTSGSCSGELIRRFVERTYDILRTKTSFGDEVNVHIVQCDNRVRASTKVTSLAQLEEYADSFWVSGGGGTDFKPVFEYVDALVDEGEFADLRGLVYFTDGYGAFPTHAPGYEVAFVFVDDEDTEAKVPGWAMKIVMTQEEVMQR